MKLPAFEDLSKEQDLIYNLDLDGNFLVSGPPGTGKSVMALYRAQVLTFDEREPAILMYNNVLKQYTSQAADSLQVAGFVRTFHSWLWRFWRDHFSADPPVLEGDRYAPDWSEITNQFFASPPVDNSVADVLIDEGQDLPLGFFRLAKFFTENITVFADENQRLNENNTTLSEIATAIKADEVLTLRRNYRNTAEIAAVASHYYSGAPTGIPDPPARRGEKPTLRRHVNDEDFADFVSRYVRARTNLSIGIACESKRLQYRVYSLLRDREVNLPVQMYVSGNRKHAELNFESPAITIVNYRSLKGLEFDSLIVPELQQVTADPTSASTRMMFYVVMSRARNELHLSYSGEGDAPPLVASLGGLVREL